MLLLLRGFVEKKRLLGVRGCDGGALRGGLRSGGVLRREMTAAQIGFRFAGRRPRFSRWLRLASHHIRFAAVATIVSSICLLR